MINNILSNKNIYLLEGDGTPYLEGATGATGSIYVNKSDGSIWSSTIAGSSAGWKQNAFSLDYLPLAGGTMIGDIWMQENYIVFGATNATYTSGVDWGNGNTIEVQYENAMRFKSSNDFRFEPGSQNDIFINLGTDGVYVTNGANANQCAIKLDPGNGTARIWMYNDDSTFYGIIQQTSLNANRTWTLPDATGTIALTSDIVIDSSVLGATNQVAYFTGATAISGNAAYTFDPNTLTLTVPNLVVGGTTTVVNSTVTNILDPIFTIGGTGLRTVDDNKDRGIAFEWNNGATSKTGFFGFDDSDSRFKFIPDSINTSEVITGNVGDAEFNTVYLTGLTASNFVKTDGSSGLVAVSQGSINLSGFNNDLSFVSGAGATNYITKWTGATSVGTSLIRDNNISVAIGTAPATDYLFSVNNQATHRWAGNFIQNGNGASGSAAAIQATTSRNSVAATYAIQGYSDQAFELTGFGARDSVGVLGSIGTDVNYGKIVGLGSSIWLGLGTTAVAYNLYLQDLSQGATMESYNIAIANSTVGNNRTKLGVVKTSNALFYNDTDFVMIGSTGVFNFSNIDDLIVDGSPDSANDYVMTWDASATKHKKVLLSSISGGGSVSGSGAANRIAYWTGTTALSAESALSYNPSTNTLGITGGSGNIIIAKASNLTNVFKIGTTGVMTISNSAGSTSADTVVITGRLVANYKSFEIPHPTRPGKLRHGNLEGPEDGVYQRGSFEGSKIVLPDYWNALTRDSEVTVQLTPIGPRQSLYVKSIKGNIIEVGNNWPMVKPKGFFVVHGSRGTFEVEINN